MHAIMLILLQIQGVFRRKEKGKVVVSTAEKKLLIVLCYYILFGIVSMVFSSLTSSNISRQLFEAIVNHFTCEALGYTPGKCDRGLFQQYSITWLFSLTLVLLALIPVVSLLFVLNTEDIKKWLRKKFHIRSRNQGSMFTRTSILHSRKNSSLSINSSIKS